MQAGNWIRLDRNFLKEVLAEPGGEHLVKCSDCGTCVGTCPVSQHYPSYNPRLLFHKISLGMRDEVLSSPEIWLCSECDNCYPRCIHEIHISEVMKAIRNIALREGYERPGPTARVNTARCTGCAMCATACPYSAIELADPPRGPASKKVASVEPALCTACGMCSSVCPSLSISVEDYADVLLHDELLNAVHSIRASNGGQEPGILAVICNWCLRAQPDILWASSPPEGVQVISVPCSGRVSPTLITNALQQGVEGVLVVGCAPEECHYRHGNQLEQNRLRLLRTLLDLLGVDQMRVQFAQLGALDRGKLPVMIREMIRQVGEIKHEQELASSTFRSLGTLEALL